MSGVPQIEIKESVEELKEIMKKQKTGLGFAKVQSLYLFKIKAGETVRYIAVLVGRGESTIHRWLKVYRERGVKGLLKEEEAEKEVSSGRPGRREIINVETAAAIRQELKEEEGFASYREVQQWLGIVKGLNVHYISVWRICRDEFQAKLKIPRPQSNKQAQGKIEKFKLGITQRLMELASTIKNKMGKTQNIRYWCGDETRLGLQTIGGKKLTSKGIKPSGEKQWKFDYYYLYGLVEPKTGESFYDEFSHLNTQCFAFFLEIFSQNHSEEIQIIQIDNASSHRTKNLVVPDNVILLFQPPYPPEVNPIER